MDLRPFVVFGRQVKITPGGLTRVALRRCAARDQRRALELDAGDPGAQGVDFWTPLLGPALHGVSQDAPLPRPQDVRYFLAFDVDNPIIGTCRPRGGRIVARPWAIST